jgi:hypothetical protein
MPVISLFFWFQNHLVRVSIVFGTLNIMMTGMVYMAYRPPCQSKFMAGVQCSVHDGNAYKMEERTMWSMSDLRRKKAFAPTFAGRT